MPTGPHREKPSATQSWLACTSAAWRRAEAQDEYVNKERQASGYMGGKARAKAMTAKQRREIARQAAKARWDNT